MANYLPLEIPWGSQWKNVVVSPSTLYLLEAKAVSARDRGIFMSATLVLPDTNCGIALHKAVRGMMTGDERYAFIFHNYLFQLTGWNYSPTEPTLFELHGTSLASLEDLISLLPY